MQLLLQVLPLIARPAFAEEAKADNASNLDVTAATTANVETTADLVETKVVEAPPTTENVASTESTTNVSEQAYNFCYKL